MSLVPPTPLINGLSGPYTQALQQGKAGAYGKNAAFMAIWANEKQAQLMPEAQVMRQAHVQLSQFTPKASSARDTQGFLADVVTYSAEDLAVYDGKAGTPKDGKLDLNELTTVFKPLTPNVGTAQQLAVQWLSAFDTDRDFSINLAEHTACTLMELNPLEYAGRLQAAGPFQLKTVQNKGVASDAVVAAFYNSGNTSTPEGREAKQALALKTNPVGQVVETNWALAVCAQLRASLNLDRWTDWHRRAWPA